MGLQSQLTKIIKKALAIQKSLGTRTAAGYLRNRQATFEEAHQILLGRAPRFA
jgi:hypothetical protein